MRRPDHGDANCAKFVKLPLTVILFVATPPTSDSTVLPCAVDDDDGSDTYDDNTKFTPAVSSMNVPVSDRYSAPLAALLLTMSELLLTVASDWLYVPAVSDRMGNDQRPLTAEYEGNGATNTCVLIACDQGAAGETAVDTAWPHTWYVVGETMFCCVSGTKTE